MRADEATSLEQVKKSGGGGVERTGKRREGGSGNYDDGHRTTNNEGEEEEEGPAAAEEKREGGRMRKEGTFSLSPHHRSPIPLGRARAKERREGGRGRKKSPMPRVSSPSLLCVPWMQREEGGRAGEEKRARERRQPCSTYYV